jgi:hypothetical protein
MKDHHGKSGQMNPLDFTRADLHELVRLIVEEFRAENARIQTATKDNPAYAGCRGQGISLFNTEYYYQYTSARALLPTFRFRVRPEDKKVDLALFAPSGTEPVALCEMKRWMTSTGEREIPAMANDIEALANKTVPTFLLIFSVSPLGDTEGNVRSLVKRLAEKSGRTFGEPEWSAFSTNFVRNNRVEEGEFFVLAIPIRI